MVNAQNTVRDREVVMPLRAADSYCPVNRIIPGDVDVIPFSVKHYDVPGMGSAVPRSVLTVIGDAEGVQQHLIGPAVAVANAVSFQ